MHPTPVGVPTPAQLLSVQSNLMQDYRLAESTQVGVDFAAVFTSSAGEPEIFAVQNGQVADIYPDTSSDTGYSYESLNFPKSAVYVAAAAASSAPITVFASGSDNTLYSLNISAHPVTSANWKSIAMPSGVDTVCGLKSGLDGSGQPFLMMLAADTTNGSCGLYLYSPSSSSWQGGAASTYSRSRHVWCPVPIAMSGATTIGVCYVGPPVDGVSSVEIGQFSAQGLQLQVQPVRAETFSMVTCAGANIFALSPPVLGQESSQGVYLWSATTPTQITTGEVLGAIAAGTNAANELEIAALRVDGVLFHARQSAAGATVWTELTEAGVGGTFVALQIVPDSAGVAHILAIDSANHLNLIWQDPDTSDWISEEIEFTAPGQIECIPSYRTVIKFYDQNDAPAPGTEVKLTCDQAMTLRINGATETLVPNQPWIGNADYTGCVTLSYPTASLGTRALSVWSSFMEPNDVVAVDPSGAIQARLQSLPADGSGLINEQVTVPGGPSIPLLPLNLPNRSEVAISLSQVAAQAMTLASTAAATSATTKYLHRNCDRRVARTITGDSGALQPGEIDFSAVPAQNWQVTFASGSPVFQTQTQEQYAARQAALKNMSPAGGVFDWLSDWGDVIVSIAQGFVDLVDFAIDKLANGIQATVTFVVDKVTYYFQTMIQWVRQAVDLVESIFSTIGAAFEQLFGWLGYLFNWQDILAMKDGIANVLQIGFDMAEGALGYLGTKLSGWINAFSAQLTEYFETVANNLTGQSTVTVQQATPAGPFNMDAVNSTNIVMSSVVNNPPPNPQMPSFQSSAANASVLDILIAALTDALETYREGGTNYQNFASALDSFKQMAAQMITAPDQALLNGLAGFVRLFSALANAVLSTINTIITAILNALIAVLQQMLALFTAAWDIPFLSDFYAYITQTELNPKGSTLCTSDLIALIAAIPFTVAYKIVMPNEPLPDLTQYTAADLLSGLGISSNSGVAGGATGNTVQRYEWPIPPAPISAAFWVLGLVLTFPYSVTSCVLDGSKPGSDNSDLAIINIFSEFGLAVTGLPLWSTSSPADVSVFISLVGMFSTAFDGVVFLLSSQLPETFGSSDAPVIVTTFFGVGLLALNIVYWATDSKGNGVYHTGGIIGTLPECLKFLRINAIANNPRIGRAARLGLGSTDLVGYMASAWINFQYNMLSLVPGGGAGLLTPPQAQTG